MCLATRCQVRTIRPKIKPKPRLPPPLLCRLVTVTVTVSLTVELPSVAVTVKLTDVVLSVSGAVLLKVAPGTPFMVKVTVSPSGSVAEARMVIVLRS